MNEIENGIRPYPQTRIDSYSHLSKLNIAKIQQFPPYPRWFVTMRWRTPFKPQLDYPTREAAIDAARDAWLSLALP